MQQPHQQHKDGCSRLKWFACSIFQDAYIVLMFDSSFLLLLLSSKTRCCPEVCYQAFPSPCLSAPTRNHCFQHSHNLLFSKHLIWLQFPSSRSPQISRPPLSSVSSSQDMSAPVQTDDNHLRLDLQQQIQRGVVLATQLCHAASKEDLNSKEWTAN